MAAPMQRPTPAFIGASWAALLLGAGTYCGGLLMGGTMALNERGYYFVLLAYGLFAAVSLQKSVRDRLEGLAVTNLYFGLCWVSLGLCLALLVIGLFNAGLPTAEKGFYAMAYGLSLFAAVAIQKNVRDVNLAERGG